MKYSFIDEAKIFVQSGKGGNGSSHFRRERCVEFGGPDGGNGGKGGDLVLIGNANMNTLVSFRYQKHYRAQNGENGSGQCKFGSAGKDLIINVPVGTEIYDEETGYLMSTITYDKEEKILLKGGNGGIGNIFFKSSTNQAPRKAMPGFDGQQRWVKLVMKILADVGLIGKPNAGKSSLLRSTTNNDPKVASYQFTTLSPNLGFVETNNILHTGFVMADLPGLIEGASDGRGLGIEFLKHIEKCKILCHLIDVFDKNIEEITREYEVIRNELGQYDSSLLDKKEIVVFNKIDMVYDKVGLRKIVENFEKDLNKEVFMISTYTGEGIQKMIHRLNELVNEAKDEESRVTGSVKKEKYRPQANYKMRGD
jgi:GTP-binding protein